MTLQEAFDLGFESVKTYLDDHLGRIEQRLAAVESRQPENGDPGPAGKDGIGLAGALIDKDGILHLTLTDGTITKLGCVVGKDGDPGKDGKDGVGFEHLDVVQDGERGMILRFTCEDEVKEFPIRLYGFIDRGVFKTSEKYTIGDAVSWGGSLWIAIRDTTNEKPDRTPDAWRLAVKHGRDGKDGKLIVPESGPVKINA